MLAFGYIIYIFFYGGAILPFTLGEIHKRAKLLIVPKMVLWWWTWLTALFWLIMSLIEGLFDSDNWAFELSASKDQHASAILGLDKDKTISNYIGVEIRDRRATKGMLKFDRALSYFDKTSDNHCLDSIGQ